MYGSIFSCSTTRTRGRSRAALESGALTALIDARCLAELAYVLDYPQFVHRNVDKAAALAVVARLSQLVEPAAPAEDARPLPKCKDRDDQKFLELAHAAQADWLVSKDRAVLKLAKRIARDFGFQIAQPAPFVTAIACPERRRRAFKRMTSAA